MNSKENGIRMCARSCEASLSLEFVIRSVQERMDGQLRKENALGMRVSMQFDCHHTNCGPLDDATCCCRQGEVQTNPTRRATGGAPRPRNLDR